MRADENLKKNNNEEKKFFEGKETKSTEMK
jgi:hypothetical protein